MSTKSIQITEYDFRRLQQLLEVASHTNFRGREDLAELNAELAKATVVAPHEISRTVITMNSTVVLLDLETDEEETYTLVFPEAANITAGRLSVLAPIGTGMLGYEVGDTFEWAVPGGTRRLRVKEIVYQPEAAGDFDL
ncbi:MAG: nucleoside diphosphate kinase regulator [Anaerolineae bacterium]|nr:MAG: nucleoside diphosphate kinase regulator [Anaerolineae bacterium]